MSNATASKLNIEACRSLFGEHPEDVISPINSAANALIWLEEIFNTISSEALNKHNTVRIKHLAEAGAHIAHDIGCYAESRHDTMIDSLRTAGAIPGETA